MTWCFVQSTGPYKSELCSAFPSARYCGLIWSKTHAIHFVPQHPGCGFGWLAKVPDVGQVTTSLSLLNTLRLAFVGLVPDDLKSKANRCVLYNADCAVVGGMTFAKVLCES